jgi:cytidylate kinase
MLKNATYNLMETASVISKGLNRYDQYMQDAKDCPHCQQVWTMMKQRDEEQLNRLVDHLKQHFDKEGRPAAAA